MRITGRNHLVFGGIVQNIHNEQIDMQTHAEIDTRLKFRPLRPHHDSDEECHIGGQFQRRQRADRWHAQRKRAASAANTGGV